MLKRVITGAVFTAIILGGIYLRGWALRALMLAAMLIGMFEVYRAIKKTGAKPVGGKVANLQRFPSSSRVRCWP